MTTEKEIHDLKKQVSRLMLPEFPRTTGDVLGSMMMIPGLRGLWNFAVKKSDNTIPDISGNGMTLSQNDVPTFGLTPTIPYYRFDGSNDYFYRADDANLKITSDLTIGAWINVDTFSGKNFFGKSGAAGNLAYGFQTSTPGQKIKLYVSSDGTAVVNSGAFDILEDTWYFFAFRYKPSVSIDGFMSGTWNTMTTAVPASLFSNTGQFQIGAASALSQYLAVRMAMPFVAAAAVSDEIIENIFNISRIFFGV